MSTNVNMEGGSLITKLGQATDGYRQSLSKQYHINKDELVKLGQCRVIVSCENGIKLRNKLKKAIVFSTDEYVEKLDKELQDFKNDLKKELTFDDIHTDYLGDVIKDFTGVMGEIRNDYIKKAKNHKNKEIEKMLFEDEKDQIDCEYYIRGLFQDGEFKERISAKIIGIDPRNKTIDIHVGEHQVVTNETIIKKYYNKSGDARKNVTGSVTRTVSKKIFGKKDTARRERKNTESENNIPENVIKSLKPVNESNMTIKFDNLCIGGDEYCGNDYATMSEAQKEHKTQKKQDDNDVPN